MGGATKESSFERSAIPTSIAEVAMLGQQVIAASLMHGQGRTHGAAGVGKSAGRAYSIVSCLGG